MVIGMAGVLATAACGGGGERNEAGVARASERTTPATEKPATPVDTAPSTTVTMAPATAKPVTRVTVAEPPRRPAAPTTTTTTTTTARPPVVADPAEHGSPRSPMDYIEPPRPWVTTDFDWGGAGQVVRMEGYGFVGDRWRSHPESRLWLNSPQPGCDLFAVAEHDVVVSADGHLTGSFVVPATGTCGFAGVMEVETINLEFRLAFNCTECVMGDFYVLPGVAAITPSGTSCGTVVLAHGDVAGGESFADGLTCEEARPVLADAWRMAPLTGPDHIDVTGFSCDRLTQSLNPLQATYKCTKGSQAVWFVATGRS